MTQRRPTPAGSRDRPDTCEWAGCVETVTFRATYRSPKDVVYYCNTHGIAARDDDHLARLTSV